MRIVIDIKNLSLFGGGISQWFSHLLVAWIIQRSDVHFILLGPDFNKDFLPQTNNWEHIPINWPKWLPRFLRHPWYDNILFTRSVLRLGPDLVMSPYHDVRIPKNIPSVITIHDLCLQELNTIYPRRIRIYLLTMLKFNLRHAAYVITVSQTSRGKLIKDYKIDPKRMEVVYNAPSSAFNSQNDIANSQSLFARLGLSGSVLLYSGGSEYRKNIHRLAKAFESVATTNKELILLVTGHIDSRWNAVLAKLKPSIQKRVVFSGRLSDDDLYLAYYEANAVIFPSLCEGFGRVCMESIHTGVPLACSDLPVLREVAGDYAVYFDPYDDNEIAKAIVSVLSKKRQLPRTDERFHNQTLQDLFLLRMDEVIHHLM
jgi:glycosyltransferase involved in cell wall biosynthesis